MSRLKPIHAASTFVFSTLLLATAAPAHQHLPEEHNALEREALLEGFGWDVKTAKCRRCGQEDTTAFSRSQLAKAAEDRQWPQEKTSQCSERRLANDCILCFII